MRTAWVRLELVVVALCAATVPSVLCSAEKPEMYTFESKRAVGTIDRVESLLDVAGQLKVADAADPENGKPSSLKMGVKAVLRYDEKMLESPKKGGDASRSIRHYDKAEATIRVADDETKPQLREDRRLIAAQMKNGKAILFSPKGTLTREELDLVDPLGNSLAVDRLLPGKPVAVGDAWKHDDDVMASLCGLDSVTKNSAESTLVSVVDGSAKMEMAGRVEGVVGGLTTAIELKAKYRFDAKANRITWFGFLVKENRQPGLVGPGLDVTARLQMKIGPQESSSALSNSAMAGLPLEPTDDLQRLSYSRTSAHGGWDLLHDRKWIVISEADQDVVLRMVDKGDYVAQCNISQLPKNPAEKAPTLESFQEEIRKALGKNFGEFQRASQTPGEAGYRQWRVVVEGKVSGVPIEWIYYKLFDESGNQVVVLFTVEQEMLSRFNEVDQTLVRLLRLADGKTKVAAKPAAVAKENAKE
jgi:hypothetical protein